MLITTKRWIPVGLYFFLILSLSSIPAQKLKVSWAPWGTDKVIHTLLYSGVGFLVRRALASNPGSVGLVMALGAVDEFYQRFTPGRESSFLDWLADSTGGLIGTCLYLAYVKVRRPKTSS